MGPEQSEATTNMNPLHLENGQSEACSNGDPSGDSWQHEHLSAQLELDALRLLADAGTPELAKFAIDSVDEQQQDQLRSEFARALGFASYSELLSESAGVDTNDDKLWFVTPLADGQWIGWNYVEFGTEAKQTSREAAIAHVECSTKANLRG